jgi:hypothetical protein
LIFHSEFYIISMAVFYGSDKYILKKEI